MYLYIYIYIYIYICIYTVSFCTISVSAQIGTGTIRIISIVTQILRPKFFEARLVKRAIRVGNSF